MTDTSPVAKLVAGLPKGNGLARAVPRLFEQRGALIPAIMLLKVSEAGLDADDVEHMRYTIERAELCLGELERDGKQLLARASEQATSREGQQALFADTADFEAMRTEVLGYLREWAEEKWPDADDAQRAELLAEAWASWHGGHYDARPENGAPAHLREFAISCGALADSDPENVTAPLEDDEPADDPADDGSDDEPAADSSVPAPAFSGGA
jgi:hypothetical protein